MKDYIEKDYILLRIFPKYAIIPLATGILIHTSLYFLSAFIVNYFNFHKTNIVLNFDKYIQQISIFIIPYCFFYIYIVLGPFYLSMLDKKMLFRYLVTLEIGSILGSLFFIIYPTYVSRDIFDINNIFDEFLFFIHKNDVSCNAFPSFHCFISWLIYIALRNCNIKMRLKLLFFIISFFICISTVFTKQHGFIDIIGGVLLSEILWFFNKKNSFIYCFSNFFTKINKKLRLQ